MGEVSAGCRKKKSFPLNTHFHSFGPDPYLNGEGAFETITGVQSVGVMACAKHLIANNQEHWRYGLSANVDDRSLNEIYWYPFIRSIEVSNLIIYTHNTITSAHIGWCFFCNVCLQSFQRHIKLS